MCFICAEGECRDRGRVHWEGFVWMGRESSAPAGRRDQCYIVGFVYAHVIQVSEALLDCQAACCCCRAAFFFFPLRAQTDFSMEPIRFAQLFSYLSYEIFIRF